jgi:hypothetical protein
LDICVFIIAAFLGATSLAILILGLCGFLYKNLLVILGVVDLLALLIVLFLKCRPMPKISLKLRHFVFVLPILLVLITAVFQMFLTPPAFDELSYHLSLPERFLDQHQITSIPYNLYSNFPLNTEMLYVLGLAFSNLYLCKFIHLLLGALCAITIFTIAKKHFTEEAGFIGMLIFFSLLSVATLMRVAFNEFGLAFYCLASLLAFLNWEETKQSFWLMISGALCGLALGSKYIGGIHLAILFLLLIGLNLVRRKSFIAQFKDAAYFALPALLLFSPWLIKNYFLAGNPVYPFLFNVFGGHYWDSFNSFRYFHILRNFHGPLGTGWLRYLDLPGFLLFGFGRDVPLGLSPLVVLPFFFLLKGNDLKTKLLGFYLLFYFIGWMSSSMVIRFLAPAEAVFALLGGVLIARVADRKLLFNATLVVLILCILNNSSMIIKNIIQYQKALTDEKNYYQIAVMTKRGIPKTKRLLSVGEVRTFGMKSDVIAPTMFDLNFTEILLKNNPNHQKFAAALKAERIKYILFNLDGAFWLQQRFGYFRDLNNLNRFLDFLQTPYVVEVARSGRFQLYRVK